MKYLLALLLMCLFAQNVFSQTAGKETSEEGAIAVTGYFGTAVDSFAAQDLKDYINPEDSGETSAFSRSIFGINFGLDLTTSGNLYIYGETLHGVRSTDVDCDKTPELCEELKLVPTNDKTLGIVNSASSLEALVGLSYNFASIVEDKVQLYLMGQLGFVTVSDSGQDIMDNHHAGFGIAYTDPNHRFDGSYLEFGLGRSQFFAEKQNSRKKIHGCLNIAINKHANFFAEMRVDTDFGNSADSIQSFYGISFDISQYMKDRFKEDTE